MKKFNILILIVLVGILLNACRNEDHREFYPHSTPIIENKEASPATIVYGKDSIRIKTLVSDPQTPLSTLEIAVVINGQIVAKESIRTKGNSTLIDHKIFIPFLPELPENADIDVQLTLINVEGDKTKDNIKMVKGKRTYYETLFLVLGNGEVISLLPGENKDLYSSAVTLPNAISFKIASKITSDNQIDFSGDVWGMIDGKVRLVDEDGKYIKVDSIFLESTEKFTFDAYAFESILSGKRLENIATLTSAMFVNAGIDDATYQKASVYIEEGKTIFLEGELKNLEFNPDFFERINLDTVKFLGKSDPWRLYYSLDKKVMLVDYVQIPFPNGLVITGTGIGPVAVSPIATAGWNFDDPTLYLPARKVKDGYQFTAFLAQDANFKPFENKAWEGSKEGNTFTLPAVLTATKDGNWHLADGAAPGLYQVIINLDDATVSAKPYTIK